MTVVTRNVADFRSCGVAIVDPWGFRATQDASARHHAGPQDDKQPLLRKGE